MTEQESDNVKERAKELDGISCLSCLDTGFLQEFVLGDWYVKYEPAGELVDGKQPIRLMKCNHDVDMGY